MVYMLYFAIIEAVTITLSFLRHLHARPNLVLIPKDCRIVGPIISLGNLEFREVSVYIHRSWIVWRWSAWLSRKRYSLSCKRHSDKTWCLHPIVRKSIDGKSVRK